MSLKDLCDIGDEYLQNDLNAFYDLRMLEKARLAQSVERLALNQVVVGSSPTVGEFFC